jgi:hypothetical protein
MSDEQGAEIYRLKEALVDVLTAETLQEAKEIAADALGEPRPELANA